MPALNTVLFAPRYAASRFNVLNPWTYLQNATTPMGRIVLRQQMSEMIQYSGMIASTLAIAKAAGADVSLDPESSDFLKIKTPGGYRFDVLAGLQQPMRLIYRTGEDILSAAKGEKAAPGESAIDIGERFLRSKLGPVPSYFVDFLSRKTYTGQPFSFGKGALERVTPLVWQDFVTAYQRDGWGGVGMASPGLTGVGVQMYDSPPISAALEKAQPLTSELIRLNHSVPEIKRVQGESDDAFTARQKVFGEALTHHGLNLVGCDQYRQAPDDVKLKSIDLLNRRIHSSLKSSEPNNDLWLLEPSIIVSDARENLQERPSKPQAVRPQRAVRRLQ